MRLVDRLRDEADPSFRTFFIQVTVAGCLTLLAFPAAILLADFIRPPWPVYPKPALHLERSQPGRCIGKWEKAQPRVDGETSTGKDASTCGAQSKEDP